MRMTNDGLVDVVDIVMVITANNCNRSNETLRNLKQSLFDTEAFVVRSGRRYATLEVIIDLIMVLPGVRAKRMRKQFKNIIVRYLDGDRSMCHEIEANLVMGKVKSYTAFASKIMNQVDDINAKKAHEMPPTFYIYATKSAAFPGLIKIGRTEDVAKRLSQLNTSCAPAPHVIVAVAPSFDKVRDEKTAHAFFSDARREGEFFELGDAEVIFYFATHITAQYNTELVQNITRLQGLHV